MPSADRKYGTPIRIDTYDDEKLIALAKSLKISKRDIIGKLIIIQEQYDVLGPDLYPRLKALLERGSKAEQRNDFEGLDDAPRAMKWMNDTFNYVEVQKNGLLKITKLSSECTDSIEVVKEFRRQVDEGIEREQLHNIIEGKDQEISDLRLGDSQAIKIPVCNKGSRLIAEGREFRGCPKGQSNTAVSVDEWCRVYSSGLPCALFAEVDFKPNVAPEAVKDNR